VYILFLKQTILLKSLAVVHFRFRILKAFLNQIIVPTPKWFLIIHVLSISFATNLDNILLTIAFICQKLLKLHPQQIIFY
jgi:hypothetical protein